MKKKNKKTIKKQNQRKGFDVPCSVSKLVHQIFDSFDTWMSGLVVVYCSIRDLNCLVFQRFWRTRHRCTTRMLRTKRSSVPDPFGKRTRFVWSTDSTWFCCDGRGSELHFSCKLPSPTYTALDGSNGHEHTMVEGKLIASHTNKEGSRVVSIYSTLWEWGVDSVGSEGCSYRPLSRSRHFGSETRLDGHKQCTQTSKNGVRIVYARTVWFQIQNDGFVIRVNYTAFDRWSVCLIGCLSHQDLFDFQIIICIFFPFLIFPFIYFVPDEQQEREAAARMSRKSLNNRSMKTVRAKSGVKAMYTMSVNTANGHIDGEDGKREGNDREDLVHYLPGQHNWHDDNQTHTKFNVFIVKLSPILKCTWHKNLIRFLLVTYRKIPYFWRGLDTEENLRY